MKRMKNIKNIYLVGNYRRWGGAYTHATHISSVFLIIILYKILYVLFHNNDTSYILHLDNWFKKKKEEEYAAETNIKQQQKTHGCMCVTKEL